MLKPGPNRLCPQWYEQNGTRSTFGFLPNMNGMLCRESSLLNPNPGALAVLAIKRPGRAQRENANSYLPCSLRLWKLRRCCLHSKTPQTHQAFCGNTNCCISIAFEGDDRILHFQLPACTWCFNEVHKVCRPSVAPCAF